MDSEPSAPGLDRLVDWDRYDRHAAAHLPWACSLLVLASCAFFAWRLRRWYREPGRTGVLARVKACRLTVHDMLFPECPYDRLHARVKEIEQARSVRNVKVIFRVFHGYNTFALAGVGWGYARGAPSQPLADAAGVLGSYLVVFVLDVFTRLVTLCTLRVIILGTVCFHLWILLSSDWGGLELFLTRYIAFMLLWRMNVSVLYTDFPVVIGLNLVSSLVTFATVPYRGVAQLEVFGLAMILVGSCFNKSVRIAEIRATLEATHSRNFLDAMDALLSNICDVVLHLSHDFRIRRPSSRFATMLLKSSPHGMKGDRVLDFLGDAQEAARVADFLNRTDSAAAVLHTSFKDSHGATVRVQLFHARGLDIDDQTFHVVGVQETAETQKPLSPDVDQFELFPVIDAAREDEAGSGASSSHVGAKIVWVDPLADGIPISKSSAEFAAFWPSSLGARFLDSVCNQDDFLHELRRPRRSRGGGEPFQLQLNLPHRGRVQADVEVERAQQDDPGAVKLTIRNLRKAGRRSRREPRPRSQSSDSPAPRPVLWEAEPQGAPPAGRPGMDEGGRTVLCLDVLDGRFPVSGIVQRGRGFGSGVQVGDAFLDWFAQPEALRLAVVGSLLHAADASQLKRLLEDESTRLEAYMLCFRPTEIGEFDMHPSEGPTPRRVEVAVLSFFTYRAGASLACTVVVRCPE